MNDLTTRVNQLPDTIEDLSKFVLVGREKLNAVRAEIRAIQAVGLAKEVHEQKLAEAQDIADAVLDAEVKIGELTSRMEKAQGARTELGNNADTKSKKLEDIGLDKQQASRFERLAKHPETVEKAKADARAEGRIVTRQDVLNRIVIPTKNKSIKETINDAIQEHKDFQEKKKESVVSFEEIKQDKENKEFAVLDTEARIRKVLESIQTLGLVVSTNDLVEMAESMRLSDKRSLNDSIRMSVKTLIHFTNIIGD